MQPPCCPFFLFFGQGDCTLLGAYADKVPRHGVGLADLVFRYALEALRVLLHKLIHFPNPRRIGSVEGGGFFISAKADMHFLLAFHQFHGRGVLLSLQWASVLYFPCPERENKRPQPLSRSLSHYMIFCCLNHFLECGFCL